MKNDEIIALTQSAVMNTYARFPIALVKGQGMRVWDADGIQYLDFLAGIAVCCLGHCHPAVTEAVCRQAATLVHVSNLYHIEPQAKLARELTKITFADKVFFCNSGAEANEGAIKLARKYHADRGDASKKHVISATMSFHGRTLATLTATGQDKVKIGFDPLPPGFSCVPYDDLAALEKAMGPETGAVILEPVQGEGGVRIPSPGYLAGVRKLCDAKGALLIFDEIQTGVGRTGTFLACEAEGVSPDIATLAKGLGGGLPLGAVLATDAVAAAFVPGSHATTFGGNPLCTAAGLAVLETIVGDGLLDNCRDMGKYLTSRLQAIASGNAKVAAVRGRGLLIGLELTTAMKAGDVVKAMMDRGFLVGAAGEQVVRFAPPLIVSKSEIDALLSALEEVLD